MQMASNQFENKALGLIITFSHTDLCNENECVCDDYYNFRYHNKILHKYLDENNIVLKRGDLVNICPAYRGETIYWNDCDRDNYIVESYASLVKVNEILPKDFCLYEDPDYFTLNHWMRDGKSLFGESYILWLKSTDEMRKNLTLTDSEISTTFTDSRGKCHKIIFKTYKKCENELDFASSEKMVKQQVIKLHLYCIETNSDDKMTVLIID